MTYIIKNKTIIIGASLIAILIVCTLFSQLLTNYDPNLHGDILTDRYLNPSSKHLLGTDKFGRDIFARILYGGKVTLTIAIGVVFISLLIGITYGSISGYSGGWIDTLMMRFLDFWLAFPAFFFLMAIIGLFRPKTWYLIPILSAISWMETARIIRAEVLTVKTRDFIFAVKGLGIGNIQILLKHIIPNCINPILTSIPLKIAELVLIESALSFLGIGVQPPNASWGSLINDGRDVLMDAWWISTFPGLFILLTVISFNLIGEGLREKMSIKK